MTKPDWSKAPEWADSFGLLGVDKHDAWISLKLMKYQYLKGGKVYQFGTKGTFYLEDLHLCESRPTQWRGPEDGLPPVGTVCECQDENFEWREGAVVYVGHSDGRAVALLQCKDLIILGEHGEFRPIKTQEQRELEQLQADITAWNDTAHKTGLSLADFLYDKGYRKQ